MPRPSRLCTHIGCERKHFSLGLCRLHYSRTKRGIPLDTPLRRAPGSAVRRGPQRICSVEGCSNPHASRGYCNAHYIRMHRNQPLNKTFRRGGTLWTHDEDNVLRWHIGMMPIAEICALVNRGRHAVQRRAQQLGLDFNREAERQHGYNLKEVGEMLGASDGTVHWWIASGWLKYERTWSARHQRYSVPEEYIIDFIRERGALATSVRPTDKTWIDIVAQARQSLLLQYIARPALARILMYTPRNLSDLTKRRNFPRPAIDLGAKGGGMWYDRSEIRAWLDMFPERWTAAARRELIGLTDHTHSDSL